MKVDEWLVSIEKRITKLEVLIWVVIVSNVPNALSLIDLIRGSVGS